MASRAPTVFRSSGEMSAGVRPLVEQGSPANPRLVCRPAARGPLRSCPRPRRATPISVRRYRGPPGSTGGSLPPAVKALSLAVEVFVERRHVDQLARGHHGIDAGLDLDQDEDEKSPTAEFHAPHHVADQGAAAARITEISLSRFKVEKSSSSTHGSLTKWRSRSSTSSGWGEARSR